MFDYERYDHTYCRLTRDGEEIPSRKRSYSPSWEVPSDTEVGPPSIRDIVVENDSTNKREPVIIVRTKKPRKPASTTVSPKPVVVKKPDKSPEAVDTTAVTSAESTANQNVATAAVVVAAPHSLIKKDNTTKKADAKVKKTLANGKPATKTKISGDDSKPKAKRQYNKKKISNNSKDNKSDNSARIEETAEATVVSVSQSGRVRKLTDKAADLQKKKRKYNKSRTPETTDNPKEPSDLGDGNQLKEQTTQAADGDKQPELENEVKQEPKQEPAKKKVKKENNPQPKKTTKRQEKGNEKNVKQTPTPVKSKSKSKATPVKTTSKKPAKSSSAPSKQTTSKVKQKLIVVSKPSPKQRRAAAAKAAEANKKSLPAARIDLDNIVQGTRRRPK